MHFSSMGKILAAGIVAAAMLAAPSAMMAQAAGDTVLKPADMQKLLPASVYYRGQTATTQLRNSGGVKFADGYYVLLTMADTSGYSSEVASQVSGLFHRRGSDQGGREASCCWRVRGRILRRQFCCHRCRRARRAHGSGGQR